MHADDIAFQGLKLSPNDTDVAECIIDAYVSLNKGQYGPGSARDKKEKELCVSHSSNQHRAALVKRGKTKSTLLCAYRIPLF